MEKVGLRVFNSYEGERLEANCAEKAGKVLVFFAHKAYGKTIQLKEGSITDSKTAHCALRVLCAIASIVLFPATLIGMVLVALSSTHKKAHENAINAFENKKNASEEAPKEPTPKNEDPKVSSISSTTAEAATQTESESVQPQTLNTEPHVKQETAHKPVIKQLSPEVVKEITSRPLPPIPTQQAINRQADVPPPPPPPPFFKPVEKKSSETVTVVMATTQAASKEQLDDNQEGLVVEVENKELAEILLSSDLFKRVMDEQDDSDEESDSGWSSAAPSARNSMQISDTQVAASRRNSVRLSCNLNGLNFEDLKAQLDQIQEGSLRVTEEDQLEQPLEDVFEQKTEGQQEVAQKTIRVKKQKKRKPGFETVVKGDKFFHELTQQEQDLETKLRMQGIRIANAGTLTRDQLKQVQKGLLAEAESVRVKKDRRKTSLFTALQLPTE